MAPNEHGVETGALAASGQHIVQTGELMAPDEHGVETGAPAASAEGGAGVVSSVPPAPVRQ